MIIRRIWLIFNPDFSSTLAHKGALYEIPQDKTKQFNQEILNALKLTVKFIQFRGMQQSAITIYNKRFVQKKQIYRCQNLILKSLKLHQLSNKKPVHILHFQTLHENDTMLKILNKFGVSDAYSINNNKSVKGF